MKLLDASVSVKGSLVFGRSTFYVIDLACINQKKKDDCTDCTDCDDFIPFSDDCDDFIPFSDDCVTNPMKRKYDNYVDMLEQNSKSKRYFEV